MRQMIKRNSAVKNVLPPIIRTGDSPYWAEGTHLQKSSGENCNKTQFLCNLHLQLPYQNCRDNDQPEIQRAVNSCVGTGAIPHVVLDTDPIWVIYHEVAIERPPDEDCSEEVRQRQQNVEDVRPPQDPSKRFSRVEDALVEEYDGCLAGSKCYGIQQSARKIQPLPYGCFPPIQIPIVRIVAVVPTCAPVSM